MGLPGPEFDRYHAKSSINSQCEMRDGRTSVSMKLGRERAWQKPRFCLRRPR